jgi:hypothetical protein
MANQYLQPLLQKEVSHKEFLGILGMSHILKLLTGKSLDAHRMGDGHGSAMYGSTKARGSV